MVFTSGLQGVIGFAALPNYGKWYWEASRVAGIYAAAGVGESPVTNHLGSPGSGPQYPVNCAYTFSSRFLVKGSSSTITMANYSLGSSSVSTVGFAYDGAARRLDVYQGNAHIGFCSFTGTTPLYPAAANAASSSGSSVRVHFQPSEMTFSPPAGYVAA
jgi:hypothetical protein